MLLLTSTSDIVRVVTGSATTVAVHASWVDNASGTITPGRTNTAISTATTTTVVGSPGASTQRNVKHLNVRNTHASTATTVDIQHFDGTTSVSLWMGTLAAGEMVKLDETGDWVSFNSVGLNKTATNAGGILRNTSTATSSAAFATDTYLAGSSIPMPSGGPLAGGTYRLLFEVLKTTAGTAAPVITLRFGTAGTTSDSARLTFTLAAQTGVADIGIFEVYTHFRAVGSGSSAVMAGVAHIRHALAATGLNASAAITGTSGGGFAGDAFVHVVSSGFDSTVAGSILGASFNGGTSFSGTCMVVQSQYFI
jgi:hypothetical protein